MQGLSETSSHAAASRSTKHLLNTNYCYYTPAQSATPQNGAQVITPHDLSGNSSSVYYVVPGILSASSIGIRYDSLLKTCSISVKSSNGSVVVARALLDSASSASFVSEHLTQTLSLPRTKIDIVISGIVGI